MPRVRLGGLRLEVRVDDTQADGLLTRALGPFCGGPADLEPVSLGLEVRPGLVLEDLGPLPGPGLSYQRGDLRFEMPASRDAARATVDGSQGALEAAVELCLQGALLPRGGVVVHGMAGVDEHGRGWLVPGRSGAGKSTIAREAGWTRVLADEAVVLRRGPAGFELHGTPFWSEGRTLPFDTGSAPLRFLARPVKDTSARTEPLDTARAAAWLLGCVMFHEGDPAARESVLAIACDAAARAECVALHFPKEGKWLSGVVRKRAEWAPSSTAR